MPVLLLINRTWRFDQYKRHIRLQEEEEEEEGGGRERVSVGKRADISICTSNMMLVKKAVLFHCMQT